MKKFFLFVISLFLNFNIFAGEVVKKVGEKVAEKIPITNEIGGMDLLILVVGITSLISIIFFAAHEAEKPHFPDD